MREEMTEEEVLAIETCGAVWTDQHGAPIEETRCSRSIGHDGKHAGTGGEWSPPSGEEPIFDTVRRLHAEVVALRPVPEKHAKLEAAVAEVARALDLAQESLHAHDAAGTGHAFEHVDWYYAARSALGAVGLAIREPAPGHADRRASEADAAGDHHGALLWRGHAKAGTGAKRVDPTDHFLLDLCPACSRWGGSPERFQRLVSEIMQRDRALIDVTGKLDALSAAHVELRGAADAVAKTNVAANARILELEGASQAERDGHAAAAKLAGDLESKAREFADLVDAHPAALEVERKRGEDALAAKIAEHGAALEKIEEEHAALRTRAETAEAQVAALAKALDARIAKEKADLAAARAEAVSEATSKLDARLAALEKAAEAQAIREAETRPLGPTAESP
jgi:hypothetical protein